MRRFWLAAAMVLCLGVCRADDTHAPIKAVRHGGITQFVIQYPKSSATPLASYHSDALAPPKPPAPPPPFPIKVPKFATNIAHKFDGMKARFNKLTNPQVRVAKTQGTLTGDVSGNNKQVTLKIPFDTSSAHWFENVPPKKAPVKASKPE